MLKRIYKFLTLLFSFFTGKSIFAFHAIIIILVISLTLQYFCMFKNLVKESVLSTYYSIEMLSTETLSFEKAKRLDEFSDVDYAEIIIAETFLEAEEESVVNNMTKTETTYNFRSFIKRLPKLVFGMDMDFNSFNKSKDYIITPGRYSSYHNLSVGDTVNLFEKDFIVAGMFDDWGLYDFILPASYSIENLKIQAFTIQVPVKITEDGFSTLAEKLTDVFQTPFSMADYDLQISQDSARFINGVLIAFALGAVCIMFFYQYILNTRKRQLSIFVLLGMKTRQILLLIITEVIFLFTLCYLAGASINNIVCQVFDIAVINYSEFLKFYFLYLGLYLIMTMVFSVVFLRKAAIKKYLESGLA